MKRKPKKWWTTAQMAKFYEVTPRTIQNWVKRGIVTPIWPDRERAWRFFPQKQTRDTK